MKYLYENHLGGYYTSDEKLDFDRLYCEICGDSDFLIGSYETKDELEKLFNSNDEPKRNIKKLVDKYF